jgi:hypothetical protein
MTSVSAGCVTGRDHHIMMNALAYAIEAIGRLPRRWQEASDREDMIALLNDMSSLANFYRVGARGHLLQRGTTIKNGKRVLNEPEACVVVSLDSVRR